ncbi:hypothetical protein [Streptomyces sp. ST2-7A]|uniref:hypothetical protein n=1 Tax=Streptomyces sp. ST2-7A TaxID=2907214 RepID=UPI001F23DEB7|nr:hypothetical protein [Streptomyces sp. ST2-7A]MCE7081476.1 hypothetical protein [Streptomyces sp. ST2-7A]
MTTWMRCHWAEGDLLFLFEVGDDGGVRRQVELRGPDRIPVTAADSEEWEVAWRAGTAAAYVAGYGETTELPVSEWEGHEPEWLTVEEFERVWREARRELARRASRAGEG